MIKDNKPGMICAVILYLSSTAITFAYDISESLRTALVTRGNITDLYHN